MLRINSSSLRRQTLVAGRRFLSQQSDKSPVAFKQLSSPFDTLDIRPRKRPDTPSYFMQRPKLMDLLSSLELLASSHKLSAFPNEPDASKWLSKADIEAKLSLKIKDKEFETLLQRLTDVERIRADDADERHRVNRYLRPFRRPGTKEYKHSISRPKSTKAGSKGEGKSAAAAVARPSEPKKKTVSFKLGYKDKFGRWHAVGHRKEAIANVIVVPADPNLNIDSSAANAAALKVKKQIREIKKEYRRAVRAAEQANAPPPAAPQLPQIPAVRRAGKAPEVRPSALSAKMFRPGSVIVNGRQLADYFVRETHRDAVLFPFQVLKRQGRFNVFATVRGGGHSGQAEAIQLAVSRALRAMKIAGKSQFLSAGLLYRDPRTVERKKTGQPKARKKYTWVKR